MRTKRPPKPKLFEKPGRVEAMKAKCAECMGDYIDGRQDCELITCPLYAYNSLRTKLPDLGWRDNGSHKAANRKLAKERLKEARRSTVAQGVADEAEKRKAKVRK